MPKRTDPNAVTMALYAGNKTNPERLSIKVPSELLRQIVGAHEPESLWLMPLQLREGNGFAVATSCPVEGGVSIRPYYSTSSDDVRYAQLMMECRRMQPYIRNVLGDKPFGVTETPAQLYRTSSVDTLLVFPPKEDDRAEVIRRGSQPGRPPNKTEIRNALEVINDALRSDERLIARVDDVGLVRLKRIVEEDF